MNMIEKIQLMMDKHGYTKADVSKGADIPYTTLDSLFKKGFENVRYPTLRKLAEFFGVSMEYLINDEIDDPNYGKVFFINLTNEERQLINLWRQLPHDEQMKIIGRIEAILENLQKKE